MDTVVFDCYEERDQLEYEFTVDAALELHAGDTLDWGGRTWRVERRHLSRNGLDVCVVVRRMDASWSIKELVQEALQIQGEHHKQWYLEQVAALLGLDLETLDREPGIAP